MSPTLDEAGMAVVNAPAKLYRVGRDTKPIGYSYITPEIDRDDTLGYRFDVLGAGVMYAATQPVGAYTESVQKFRLTAATHAAVRKTQQGHMVSGNLPADWRDHRRIIGFAVPGGLPFLDVEAPETHTALTRVLGPDLDALGVAVLDVPTVRSERRLVTRLIATWAYLEELVDHSPRYSGIRFVSKLGDHECWALFEGTPVDSVQPKIIPIDDLRSACEPLDVWAH